MLQVAAGQLGEGIGPALITTPGVGGVGGAGQRLQRGQHDLAGLRLQQPLEGDHPLQGGGQPQPPATMAPLGLALGTLGVGGRQEMAQDPPQPGRVQPPRRLHQHRFGLGGQVVGQLAGCRGPAPGHGPPRAPHQPRPGRSRSKGHRTGPGRSAPHWRPPPPPSAAGRAATRRSSRPGAPPRPRPPPGRPPRPARPATGRRGGPASPRSRHTRSARAPSVSPSRGWAASSWSSATSAGSPAGWLVECVFESMAATYQPPTQTQAPTPHLGTTLPSPTPPDPASREAPPVPSWEPRC